MRKFVSIWMILMLGLVVFGGLAIAQGEKEKEEAAESKTVETRIITQMPQSCNSMMKQMGEMMPGMMGRMGPGRQGCGKMGCGGEGEMGCGMGCGSCCKQLQALGCPSYLIKMADELELSEKQVGDLKAICMAHKKDVIRKQADIKIAKMELNELVGLSNADLTKVKAKITEIGSMKLALCLSQVATIEKAHKVLTAEQMTKFKDMKKGMCCSSGKAGMSQKMKKCIKMKIEE